jgi:hypothetical protein
MMWLPLTSALVQHASMTPVLDTGLLLDITAAAATAVPVPSSSVTELAMRTVRVGRSLGLCMFLLLPGADVCPANAQQALPRQRHRVCAGQESAPGVAPSSRN